MSWQFNNTTMTPAFPSRRDVTCERADRGVNCVGPSSEILPLRPGVGNVFSTTDEYRGTQLEERAIVGRNGLGPASRSGVNSP